MLLRPCPNKLGSKKILGVPTNFGSKIFLGWTNFLQQNSWCKTFLYPTKFWIQQNFGSNKILGPKICLGQKKLDGTLTIILSPIDNTCELGGVVRDYVIMLYLSR